jgi:hypothetical protein
MSRNAPVPVRSSSTDRHPVVVLDNAGASRRSSPIDNPLARFVLSVTPDLLRAVERSVARRNDTRSIATISPVQERRVYTSGMSFAEYDIDIRVPFVRRLTVRRATAWATDSPAVEPAPPAARRKRRAGVLGVGGIVAVTALGLIANRAGNRPAAFRKRA